MSDALLTILAGALCLGVPVAVAVVLIVLAVRASERRRQERIATLSGWATHRDWEYRQSDATLVDRFRGAPFGRGHARSATNVVLGRHDGRPFVAFDYRFTTGSGDDSTRHLVSVLAMNLGATTPGLAVAPTGTFGRLVNAITGRDILLGVPGFDEAFTVTSPSPEFARDVLQPAVLDVVRRRPDLAWRFSGDSMLVLRNGQHSPAEVEDKLLFMDAVIDRVPAHVWDRLSPGSAR